VGSAVAKNESLRNMVLVSECDTNVMSEKSNRGRIAGGPQPQAAPKEHSRISTGGMVIQINTAPSNDNILFDRVSRKETQKP